MNTPPEEDFIALRRLLALKRHEQPPPGYFDELSGNVQAALRASRTTRPRRADEADTVPRWILGLLERLQARPAFATLAGAGLCILILGAVVSFENEARQPAEIPSLLSEITPDLQPAPMGVGETEALLPVSADPFAPLIASSNLPVSSGSSLFNTIPALETAPVGYR